jgi:hypothetical protein
MENGSEIKLFTGGLILRDLMIVLYRDERDQARRALAFEEELADSNDQIKDLNDKITTLKADATRPIREHTAETIVTATTDHVAINGRPRGINKIDPPDSRIVDNYSPWR